MIVSGWGLAGLVTASLACFLVLYLLLDAIFGRTPIQRRIRALKLFTAAEPKEKLTPVRRALAAVGDRLARVPLLDRIADQDEELLDQLTDAPRPPEWLAVRLAAGLAAGLLLALLLPAGFGFAVGLLGGFLIPNFVLRSRVQKRHERFADDLPGMLHLILSSLRAGFTLQQAVDAAVRDDVGPVPDELSRAVSESRLNGDFEEALERVGERVRSQEVVWLVMALRLQREVGGSLAEVLQTTADTMRERAYLRRHVRTLSAEGRMSAYVLGALPLVVSLFLLIVRPEYVRPLYTEPAGFALLGLGLVLLTVGSLWLRAVTRIEV